MLTAGTFLLYETENGPYTFENDTSKTKWDILYDISGYPDLDDEIDSEDNTTLSKNQHTYEPALPDSGGGKDFDGFYDKAAYDKVKALENDVLHCAISFGGTVQPDGLNILPTGGDLMKDFNARVKIRLTSASAGDVRPVTVSVYQTTDAKTYPKAGAASEG